MPAQERTQERNRITRRMIVVALLAATAATAAVFLIKQDARGASAAAAGGGTCCCETECPCLADADGPFELTTVGSILELDECPGDESADDIPMNAAGE